MPFSSPCRPKGLSGAVHCPALAAGGRASETSKPTRSVSLALAKSFGNAGVMAGMLGVAMAEEILDGARIATLEHAVHPALQRAPGCHGEIELQLSRLAEVQPKHLADACAAGSVLNVIVSVDVEPLDRHRLDLKCVPRHHVVMSGRRHGQGQVQGAEGATTRSGPRAYLRIANAAAAIEFYKAAFGAKKEKYRSTMPGGTAARDAELWFGKTLRQMLSDEFPDMGIVGPKRLGGVSGVDSRSACTLRTPMPCSSARSPPVRRRSAP